MTTVTYDRATDETPGGAVVAITEDEIRELAEFKGEDAPVTSCYLEVDGARHVRRKDVFLQLDRLLRDARSLANGDESVAADLRRIEDHVKGGIDRSHVRGLALFSCSAHDLWRVVELPVPVRSQLVVNHSPYVRQLELVVDQNERFGVLLVDRQRARMLLFELGEVVESSDLFEQLPRGDDDDHSYTKDHGRNHSAALAHQHLRHAGEVAFRVFQEHPFERLVLGAPDELVTELEGVLHPYLRDRVVARCAIPLSASHDEVRAAALAVEADVERRKEAELVERLREAAGGGRRGVTGLLPTLQALVERRVDTLLVSHGYMESGWRCGSCGFIAKIGRRCPVCSAEMHEVDDVVEEAVEDALAQSCRVQTCVGNPDLDVMGRIGALLRY